MNEMIENMGIKDFYNNKTVLITGHTGFKGSWMCCMLSEMGAKVYGVALPAEEKSLFEIAGISKQIEESIECDIRELDDLRKIFKRVNPEIVIHMAAQPLVRESYENPVYTYEVNVMGTVNVLECCRNTASVKSVINVTTDKVYKNKEWEWGYRENEELNGYDPYSNSKSCSELVTSAYINSFLNDMGIAVSTMRAGNVIGGGDFAKDRIIPDCVRAVAKGEDIVVRNPYSTRPFQHVLEPVYAYLLVAMKQYENKECEGNYNVGPNDSDCLKTGKLVELFCDTWSRKCMRRESTLGVQFVQHPKWIDKSDGGPHEANFLKLDCSKIKACLGIAPKWDIYMTMDKLADWYIDYLEGRDVTLCMKNQIREYLSQ